MEQLKSFIKSQVAIDEEALENIVSQFTERLVEKEKLVLRQGHIASDYYFIQSGGLRIYLHTGDKEVTGWVAVENNFFTELSSLKNGTPSRFNIKAIENTVLYTISKTKMEALYQQYPLWQQFGRQVWEDAFLKIVTGILAYQTMTAEERYLAAMQESDLLHRLPLKELSSYLGITPNSLSRIRKKIR